MDIDRGPAPDIRADHQPRTVEIFLAKVMTKMEAANLSALVRTSLGLEKLIRSEASVDGAFGQTRSSRFQLIRLRHQAWPQGLKLSVTQGAPLSSRLLDDLGAMGRIAVASTFATHLNRSQTHLVGADPHLGPSVTPGANRLFTSLAGHRSRLVSLASGDVRLQSSGIRLMSSALGPLALALGAVSGALSLMACLTGLTSGALGPLLFLGRCVTRDTVFDHHGMAIGHRRRGGSRRRRRRSERTRRKR